MATQALARRTADELLVLTRSLADGSVGRVALRRMLRPLATDALRSGVSVAQLVACMDHAIAETNARCRHAVISTQDHQEILIALALSAYDP